MTLRINFDPEPAEGITYKESEYIGYAYGCGSCEIGSRTQLFSEEKPTGASFEEIERVKEKLIGHDNRVHGKEGFVDLTIFVGRVKETSGNLSVLGNFDTLVSSGSSGDQGDSAI